MSKIFKEYLREATLYKGGRSRSEFSGREMIKLSSNENQFGSSPLALAAIARHLKVLHEYPEPDDIRLRLELQKHYHHQLVQDQFFCAPSGSEIIDIICRGFLEVGDEVVVCSPTFTPFIVFSEKSGANIIDVPLKSEDFSLDLVQVLASISTKTKLLFLASPNNPSGNVISRSTLDKLIRCLPSHVVLVLDEVYHHFVGTKGYVRGLDLVTRKNPVIAINSFSKVYGLAGLRLGYGYASKEIATYLRLLCKPFQISTLALEAGIAALNDEEFVRKTVNNNAEQKRYLYAEFDSLGLKYWPTQANFILVKSPFDTTVFEEKMRKHSIMIRPVDRFGAPECVRITIGRPDQNQRLVKALHKELGIAKFNISKHVA